MIPYVAMVTGGDKRLDILFCINKGHVEGANVMFVSVHVKKELNTILSICKI